MNDSKPVSFFAKTADFDWYIQLKPGCFSERKIGKKKLRLQVAPQHNNFDNSSNDTASSVCRQHSTTRQLNLALSFKEALTLGFVSEMCPAVFERRLTYSNSRI